MAVVTVPGDLACLEAIRQFVALVANGAPAYRTQENLVPEPDDENFVMMTPTVRTRAATNLHGFADCAFTASIAGDEMTVTAVALGALLPGATVFGADVAEGTAIVSGPDDGGPGVYVVSPGQTVAQTTMASGSQSVTQKVLMAVQLDVYGPASDVNSAALSTLLRDEFATSFFAGISPGIVPVHADDPRQSPFITEEQQFQRRWTVDAQLDVDVVVTVPQQFADQLEVGIVNVDAVYPP